MSEAPAAPAKAPFGMACATKAEPRSTTKKPIVPATTATTLAAIQVFSTQSGEHRYAYSPVTWSAGPSWRATPCDARNGET